MPMPIFQQAVEQRAAAITRREAPVEVLFSTTGLQRAMMEEGSAAARFAGGGEAVNGPTTYMGMPYRLDPRQTADVLLRCVPGGSAEAKAFRAAQRNGDNLGAGSRAVADEHIANANIARMRMMLGNDASRSVLGRVATEAQMCDMIMAMVGDDHSNLTPLQRALAEVVTKYGRFE